MAHVTVSDFLSSLEKEQEINDKRDKATGINALLIKNIYNEIKIILSIPERKVAAAKCTGCSNTDCRFMFKEEDIKKSTIRIVTRYAGSGYDMECLCCGANFKFNLNPGFYKGHYELLNYVYVPLSWVRDVLGVDITKYI